MENDKFRLSLYHDLARLDKGISNVNTVIESIDTMTFDRRPDLDMPLLKSNSKIIAGSMLGNIKTHLQDVSLPFLQAEKEARQIILEDVELVMLPESIENFRNLIAEERLPRNYGTILNPPSEDLSKDDSKSSHLINADPGFQQLQEALGKLEQEAQSKLDTTRSQRPKMEFQQLQMVLDRIGITVTQFATDAGLGEPTVRALINGIVQNGRIVFREPTIETIQKIQVVLKKYEQYETREINKKRSNRGRPRSVIRGHRIL